MQGPDSTCKPPGGCRADCTVAELHQMQLNCGWLLPPSLTLSGRMHLRKQSFWKEVSADCQGSARGTYREGGAGNRRLDQLIICSITKQRELGRSNMRSLAYVGYLVSFGPLYHQLDSKNCRVAS
jgi:hypothetical protein